MRINIGKFLILFIFVFIAIFFSIESLSTQSDKEQSLNVIIVEKGFYSNSVAPSYLVFAREDVFLSYYSDLKSLKPTDAINPGIHFDYNMGVIVTLGEVYRKGYDVNINSAIFKGKTIEIYVDKKTPDDPNSSRATQTPYVIASVYNDKNIREKLRIIKFIDNQTGEFIISLPVQQIGRSPFYDIPEYARVYNVESDDYGNIEVESYGAFNNHHAFNAAYISLKENKEYRVFPPELSFNGNIAIIMTLGEKKDGGYKITANGAYTNVYTQGKELFVMVKKTEPTENTIRYYDTTRPYMVGSVQIGTLYKNIRKVHFIDENNGKILVTVNLKRPDW